MFNLELVYDSGGTMPFHNGAPTVSIKNGESEDELGKLWEE